LVPESEQIPEPVPYPELVPEPELVLKPELVPEPLFSSNDLGIWVLPESIPEPKTVPEPDLDPYFPQLRILVLTKILLTEVGIANFFLGPLIANPLIFKISHSADPLTFKNPLTHF
jgi:hypothetical protein